MSNTTEYRLEHKPSCSAEHHGMGVTDCEGNQRRVFVQCHECGARREWTVACD